MTINRCAECGAPTLADLCRGHDPRFSGAPRPVPPPVRVGPTRRVACAACHQTIPVDDATAWWRTDRPGAEIRYVCRPSTGRPCFGRTVPLATVAAIAPAVDITTREGART